MTCAGAAKEGCRWRVAGNPLVEDSQMERGRMDHTYPGSQEERESLCVMYHKNCSESNEIHFSLVSDINIKSNIQLSFYIT